MAGAGIRQQGPVPSKHSRRCLVACWLSLTILLSGALAGCGSGGVDPAACPGSTNWDEAASVEGQDTTIRGPVAGVSYRPDVNGAPTFINVGADYPDSSRFTVIVWGQDRDAFTSTPENTYKGKKVCVSGKVASYRGLPQMEVSGPDQIQVVK